MAALPPVSGPIIAPSIAPSLAPVPAPAPFNSTSPYPSSQSPGASPAGAPDGGGQSPGQPVGSGQALLSLSPVTTVEVLLICISGAVILHFVTRYLYLRAHRQLMSDGRQQQQQQQPTSSANARSHPTPQAQPSSALEMHSVKPTVIVVQPDEEVCCGIEEDAGDGSGAQQQTSNGQGSQRKPKHWR